MKTSFKEINEIFDFKGLWDMPSKCGLKISQKNDKFIIVVTELYQDNPGTSITQAASLLVKQISEHFQIPTDKLTYIEHNPGMNSKLSFYDEEFYLVTFDIDDNERFINPKWEPLPTEMINDIF
jgi:hypothetical protein